MLKYTLLFALLAFAVAGNELTASNATRDLEDITKRFLECIRKALDGGLPSAQIPDHNPLWLRDLSIPIDTDVISGTFKLQNGEIDHITTFTVKDLVGELSDNRIVLDYVINYVSMVLKYEYELDFAGLTQTGKISIDMQNLDMSGVWNMTMDPKNLDDFDLKLALDRADVRITGLGILETIINYDLSYLLTNMLNANKVPLSSGLKARFNTMWLDPDHLYRIDAIIENCRA